MKSGFYIIDATAHYFVVNGVRKSLCGVDSVSLSTPYVQREHLGVVPMCRACQESMRPTVTKTAPEVEACTCAACRGSSVSRHAKAEGA